MAKKVKISQLLNEERILIAQGVPDKIKLLESLISRLCQSQGFKDPQNFLAKVMEREQGISTTLDTGLSLPHARMDGLDSIVAAMALIPQGLPDPKQPDLTIRMIFLFFSPNQQSFFSSHLQLLRGVSSFFQPALIEQLSQASTPAAVWELIRKVESQ